MTASSTRRLFFAWMLPPELGVDVDARVRQLLGTDAAAFRRPRPDGLHVTALFLGDVEGDAWLGARTELEGHCRDLAPPQLCATHAGAFPSDERARILWLGLDASSAAALAPWRRRLVELCSARGWSGEDAARPYRPHLTVARARRTAARPAALLASSWALDWVPAGLSLVESVRVQGEAPRYVPRFSVGLR